jgi:hypothetical protein
MPPRWSKIPTRQDPDYRKLDDRMNFAVHVAAFAAINSGAWFVRTLQQETWSWPIWLSGIWFVLVVAHAVYIFAIADYSN